MDVRLAHKFDSLACPNSRSFPLYQPISGMGLAANIRRAGFTFFGVFGTERNIQWLEEVEAEIPKGAAATTCQYTSAHTTSPLYLQGFCPMVPCQLKRGTARFSRCVTCPRKSYVEQRSVWCPQHQAATEG